MSLRERVKALSGNKRRFVLLRIADMDTKAALKLCGVVRGTYNSWLQNEEFVELYRDVRELSSEFKQEAIQLIRRDNQLEAVLLEGLVITKMKEELRTGEYSLIKSHLAREVYSKLITDLDIVPAIQVNSWEQRLTQIFGTNPPDQIEEGRVIDAEFETTGEQTPEHCQSQLTQESKQISNATEEKAQG